MEKDKEIEIFFPDKWSDWIVWKKFWREPFVRILFWEKQGLVGEGYAPQQDSARTFSVKGVPIWWKWTIYGRSNPEYSVVIEWLAVGTPDLVYSDFKISLQKAYYEKFNPVNTYGFP